MNKTTLPKSAYQDVLGVNANATLFLAILNLDFIHFGTFVDLYLDEEDGHELIRVIHYPQNKFPSDDFQEHDLFIDSCEYNKMGMYRTTFYVPEQFRPHAREIIKDQKEIIPNIDWNARLEKLLEQGAKEMPSEAYQKQQDLVQAAMDKAQEKAQEQKQAIIESRKMKPENVIDAQLPESVLQGLKDHLKNKQDGK